MIPVAVDMEEVTKVRGSGMERRMTEGFKEGREDRKVESRTNSMHFSCVKIGVFNAHSSLSLESRKND